MLSKCLSLDILESSLPSEVGLEEKKEESNPCLSESIKLPFCSLHIETDFTASGGRVIEDIVQL